MIKTFVNFTLKKLFPFWIVAFLLLVVTTSFFQAWHGALAVLVASFDLPTSSSSLEYRLYPAGELNRASAVLWPNGVPISLNAHKSSLAAADFVDDLPVTRNNILLIESLLGRKETLLEAASGSGLWRPVRNNYKQLVARDVHVTFVDQIVQRGVSAFEVLPGRIEAGYRSVPIDLFGGVYLFSSLAPVPIEAIDLSADTLVISTLDKSMIQFMAEIWAVDNEYWAHTNWIMMVIASLMSVLPWLVFPVTSKKWTVFFTVITFNIVMLVVFLLKLQWFYPILLPGFSVMFAFLWRYKFSVKDLVITQLEKKQLATTDMWVGHLLDEGKPDAALRHLQEIQADSADYSYVWQKVANGFERSRQYEKSIECYRAILASDSKHSIAKQKIKKLKTIVDGTKTMAIAQIGGELPVGQIDNLSLGRYQISREIGRGAMGIVYEAEDPKIHRKVALKVVHLKNLGVDEMEGVKLRFFREAQAAGKLNHPHIVTVYDVGEEHDVAYIAMDLLAGKPLSAFLTQRPIELAKVVKWIAQAADALGYAHENDIIHRDVKPANMIIEEKLSRLKLTDFGVARIAGVQQTQTGIVLGSPSYMSPEQIRGESLTGSTDIFSLGVTLYQCITGELPFVGDTLPALAYSITQSKQLSPRNLNPDVSVSLVRIVNKALQKDPRERFETAFDFASSLNKWVIDNS